jgi:hypothetical protein
LKTHLDTTDRGLSATVLPLGTSGRFYTLAVRPTDESSRIEVDATAEGLGVLVGAVLEQFEDEVFAELIAAQVGPRMAGELGLALVAVAKASERAAARRVTER